MPNEDNQEDQIHNISILLMEGQGKYFWKYELLLLTSLCDLTI